MGVIAPGSSLQWQVYAGTPGWSELAATDPGKAQEFYAGLLGWTSEQFGTEHRSDYSVWYLGEDSVFARVSMIREYIAPGTRPHWLLYLGADPAVGTDELVHQAIALGARVRIDPYDSSLGRVAVL